MAEEGGAPEVGKVPAEEIEIEFVDDGPDAEAGEELAAELAEPAGRTSVVEEEVDRLTAEVDRLRDSYLRKLAEFDNFRKRTEREREDLQRTAAEGLIRELLPVVDNFDRALQHAGNGDPEGFRQGVQMIARQIWDLLERAGVAVVDPVGMPFRPELHEAVQRVEGTEHEPGTVVSVLAKGYTLGGKLIRPAMVGVAVAPAQPPSEAAGEGGTRW
jgi:molecular chaperone GrpE